MNASFPLPNKKSNPRNNKSFPVSRLLHRHLSKKKALKLKDVLYPGFQLSDVRGEDILLRLPLDPHRELPGLVSPSDS